MGTLSKLSAATASALWLAALVAIPARAAAYLDPASGSLFLQILLGGVAGLGLLVKLFWNRVKAIFVRSSRAPKAGDASPDA